METKHSHVTYGPLNEALLYRRRQHRVKSVHTPDGAPRSLVPQVVNSSSGELSVVAHSRASNIVLWGLPGDRLEQYVSTMSSANSILTSFHTKRRAAIEGGQTPSVQDSLDALQG